MTKSVLRKQMRDKLSRHLQPAEREAESALVRDKLLSCPWFVRANRVSIYVSNEQEIATDEIIRIALRQHKQVFIPRFGKGSPRMEMLQLSSEAELDSLDSTLWGIRQHPASVSPPSFEQSGERNALDLVVMPGLAFTRCGKRLGHGRGFYDRFLREYAQKWTAPPPTVGLALSAQLVDDLPMEEHDRKLDLVLCTIDAEQTTNAQSKP